VSPDRQHRHVLYTSWKWHNKLDVLRKIKSKIMKELTLIVGNNSGFNAE